MAQASRGDEGLGQRQAERRLLKSQDGERQDMKGNRRAAWATRLFYLSAKHNAAAEQSYSFFSSAGASFFSSAGASGFFSSSAAASGFFSPSAAASGFLSPSALASAAGAWAAVGPDPIGGVAALGAAGGAPPHPMAARHRASVQIFFIKLLSCGLKPSSKNRAEHLPQ